MKPLHKKNPDVGQKPLVFSSKVLVEQEDAASFGENEEVDPTSHFSHISQLTGSRSL
jgi:hypothetical protein